MGQLLDRLVRHVRGALRAVPAHAREGPVCAAVSGGGDSVVLAAVLERLRREGPAPALRVLHVDHGLRPSSGRDAALVRDLAAKLGVPFACRRLSLGSPPPGQVWETRAREARYEALAAMAREAGSRLLATAHHRDDQIETVLFRILRGTGVAGLRGIPALRPFAPGDPLQVWRPLLGLGREELAAALRETGLAHARDATNLALDAARNRIRHLLRPFLQEHFGPGIDRALLLLASSAHTCTQALEARAQEVARDAILSPFPGRAVVRDPAFLEAPAVREALARRALSLLAPDRFVGPPPALLAEAADLMAPDTPAGTRRGGRSWVLMERARNAVLFQRLPLPPPPPEMLLRELPARVSWPFPPMALEVAMEPPPGRLHREGTLWLDPARLRLPLRLAPPTPGERFVPLGARTPVRLLPFLGARGLPRLDRSFWPVLRDAGGQILCVPGVEASEALRVGPTTRSALRVTV